MQLFIVDQTVKLSSLLNASISFSASTVGVWPAWTCKEQKLLKLHSEQKDQHTCWGRWTINTNINDPQIHKKNKLTCKNITVKHALVDTYVVGTFWKEGREATFMQSTLAHVWPQYEIWLPVLLPSSVLLPPLSQCVVISVRENETQVSKMFDVHRAVHRNIISIVKPTRCTNVSNLFYSEITLYMFRTVFPSVIRSSRMYIQQQAYVKQILLFAC